MPLCHYQRAKNCRLLSGLASFGYCAAKDGKYYGFKNLINRKLLAHTLALWINRHSLHPLRFEQLISD